MIDWSLLFLLLRKYGHNVARVSKAVGLDYSHCGRLARGDVAEPRFNSGVKLLDYASDNLPVNEFLRCRVG